MLLCRGTAADGCCLFVKDGKLRYVHNYVTRAVYGVASEEAPPGRQAELRVHIARQ